MRAIKRGAVRMGWACAQALGYGRDEPQRSRVDRRLRLARLYWPSLARSMELREMKVGEAFFALFVWLGMGAGFAGASAWSAGGGVGWALSVALAVAVGQMAVGQMAIARWLFLAPVFEARGSARLALTGPGGRFEGYLDRPMAERARIAARHISASAACARPGARRARRL